MQFSEVCAPLVLAIQDVIYAEVTKTGGSITAACFLERFVNKVPWAHIDIAGTAWAENDLPLSGQGATGFGVRLLDTFLRDTYEK